MFGVLFEPAVQSEDVRVTHSSKAVLSTTSEPEMWKVGVLFQMLLFGILCGSPKIFVVVYGRPRRRAPTTTLFTRCVDSHSCGRRTASHACGWLFVFQRSLKGPQIFEKKIGGNLKQKMETNREKPARVCLEADDCKMLDSVCQVVLHCSCYVLRRFPQKVSIEAILQKMQSWRTSQIVS